MVRRLHKTAADYLVIAISPALIMALVTSLVYFLLLVFYRGEFHFRLQYIMFLFIFAAVLIARLAMEEGREKAMLYSLALGGATAFTVGRFSDLGLLANLGLLGVIWWCADRLTWDCTLIDEHENATGEGLLQTVGLDEPEPPSAKADAKANGAAKAKARPAFAADVEPAGVTAREHPPQETEKTLWRRVWEHFHKPRAPGVWVIYFSLAALPIFGFGQRFIYGEEARRSAFFYLFVYVASALGLLMATCFLGLRRYLRQRRVEMPDQMAVVWIATGCALIGALLVVSTILPRRNPVLDIAQSAPPFQFGSPGDNRSTRFSWGDEGVEDEERAGNASGEPRAESGKPGAESGESGKPRAESEKPERSQPQGQRQSQDGGKSSGDDASPQQANPSGSSAQQGQSQQRQSQQGQSQSGQSKQGDGQGSGKQDDQDSQQSQVGQQEDSSSRQSSDQGRQRESSSQNRQGQSGKPPDQGDSRPSSSGRQRPQDLADSESRPQEQPQRPAPAQQASPQEASQPRPQRSSPPRRLFNPGQWLGSLFGWLGVLAKLAFYAVLVVVGIWLFNKYKDDLLAGFRELFADLRKLWERLFGKPAAEPAVAAAPQETGPTYKPFSSYPDPFARGAAGRYTPEQLVKYSFEAFEAWAREHGCPRHPEQTPHEFAQEVASRNTSLARPARALAELYSRLAYAPGPLPASSVEHLKQLWTALRS